MKGIFVGLRHHPWLALVYLFSSFSVICTIVAGFTYFISGFDLRGGGSLTTAIVVGLVYTGIKIRRPSKVDILIHHTNTKLVIKFGDLFQEDGFRVIAVSEFFDSELGLPVAEKSLHGIFLRNCFGGHNQSFDEIVERELKNVDSTQINRTRGKNKKYPIGTTALVPINDDRYLCFALCEVDVNTFKVHADVLTLWSALHGLWEKARVTLGGSPLVLPLIGSGLAGIGLPPRELLDLIILSAITETKQKQIANCILIVLTNDKFDEIDLAEVKKYWS